MTEENAQAAANENQQFNILRIYLKDVSFESPNSPKVFVEEFKPQIQVEVSTGTKLVEANIYEVVLRVSVSAKDEEKTGFLVEVEQAGIFHIQVGDNDRLNRILEVNCPTNLFPFAREAVSNLVIKGGFPQLLLAPVNFSALHQQKNAAEISQKIAE